MAGSATQLSIVYAANTGSCLSWNDPRISGVVDTGVSFSSGATTITIPGGDTVPGTNEVGGAVTGTGIAVINLWFLGCQFPHLLRGFASGGQTRPPL